MSDGTTQNHILVIDDEEAIRQSYSDYLEDMGYFVETAENGKIGIDKFDHKKHNLIVVDLRMPVMDGLQVLAHMVNIAPNVPVIVASGTGVVKDAIEAVRLGAWDYLLKPIEDLSILLHAIKNNIEKARLINENKMYQQHLETLVAEKTKELEQANKTLQEQNIQLETSLKEKDLLLQEVHHRVKNNLQVISSLLSLQSKSIKDKESLKIFNESRDRVHSMSIVHEELYRSNNFAEIEFQKYLKNLVGYIYRANSDKDKPINIQIDMQNIAFSLEKAVPFGLIINEIVSNAIKHAFPENWQDEREIIIRGERRKDNKIAICVCDNGIGIPPNKDLVSSDSLGLKLIKILGEDQLGARIEIERNNGTTFKILIDTPS